MTEKSREHRFDDVFQMVLIIVALSFDILWYAGRIPIIEIGVFMFILLIWAYGHLRGGNREYAFKIGSFNLALILLTNFYTVALLGGQILDVVLSIAISAVMFPIICLAISWILYSYLRECLDDEVARGILIGGTLGYMLSIIIVSLMGVGL